MARGLSLTSSTGIDFGQVAQLTSLLFPFQVASSGVAILAIIFAAVFLRPAIPSGRRVGFMAAWKNTEERALARKSKEAA